MSAQPEILAALSSAFMTGYDLGQRHGVTLGVWIGVAIAALLNALVKSAGLLWQWYKAKPQRDRVAIARAEFDAFEAGLPKPAPAMPIIRPPREGI